MTETSTKAKPVRDASGRFAKWHDTTKSNLKALNTKKRVGRPRKARGLVKDTQNIPNRTQNPMAIYGPDAPVELPSKPYTSPRVARRKAQEQQIAVMQRINLVLLAIAFLLVAFIYALLLTALYDWRQP